MIWVLLLVVVCEVLFWGCIGLIIGTYQEVRKR